MIIWTTYNRYHYFLARLFLAFISFAKCLPPILSECTIGAFRIIFFTILSIAALFGSPNGVPCSIFMFSTAYVVYKYGFSQYSVAKSRKHHKTAKKKAPEKSDSSSSNSSISSSNSGGLDIGSQIKLLFKTVEQKLSSTFQKSTKVANCPGDSANVCYAPPNIANYSNASDEPTHRTIGVQANTTHGNDIAINTSRATNFEFAQEQHLPSQNTILKETSWHNLTSNGFVNAEPGNGTNDGNQSQNQFTRNYSISRQSTTPDFNHSNGFGRESQLPSQNTFTRDASRQSTTPDFNHSNGFGRESQLPSQNTFTRDTSRQSTVQHLANIAAYEAEKSRHQFTRNSSRQPSTVYNKGSNATFDGKESQNQFRSRQFAVGTVTPSSVRWEQPNGDQSQVTRDSSRRSTVQDDASNAAFGGEESQNRFGRNSSVVSQGSAARNASHGHVPQSRSTFGGESSPSEIDPSREAGRRATAPSLNIGEYVEGERRAIQKNLFRSASRQPSLRPSISNPGRSSVTQSRSAAPDVNSSALALKQNLESAFNAHVFSVYGKDRTPRDSNVNSRASLPSRGTSVQPSQVSFAPSIVSSGNSLSLSLPVDSDASVATRMLKKNLEEAYAQYLATLPSDLSTISSAVDDKYTEPNEYNCFTYCWW